MSSALNRLGAFAQQLTNTDSSDSPFGRKLRKEFLFDEDWVNLNHGIRWRQTFCTVYLQPLGSFGTYPRAIRDELRFWQDKAEARPDEFIRYEYPKQLDASRTAIAETLNVDVDTVVFVPNASTGVNTVLRSMEFKKGDKIVYFATIYGACEKTVEYVTETTPAESAKIEYTYPVSDAWLLQAFHDVVKSEQDAGNTVRIAIFDTVVSLPGVRMPFERLIEACKELGVLSCMDAAHGVGHLPLDLGKLQPDFLVSNCHKWLMVPRGCAVFYVPLRHQEMIRSTLPTSHGFVPKPKPGRNIFNPLPPSAKSAFVNNFEFVGTIDNSPYLCIPAALKWRASLGGEDAIMKYCHNLARQGGQRVAEILDTFMLDNEEQTLTKGVCVSTVKLPLNFADVQAVADRKTSSLQGYALGGKVRDFACDACRSDYNTFLAVTFYNNAWWVRLSAQIYLEMADFEWGANVLKELCRRTLKGDFV